MQRSKLSILLQGLTLLLLGPACDATSLGLTVHVVPLTSHGGEQVRAHFSAIVPGPCPNMNSLCASGEDCLVHKTSLPFQGTKPAPGWCVRQWQKTVPSNFKSTMSLSSNTDVYVSMNAAPVVRENSGRLNQPAYVALPPPLRARVNCPHHIPLSVKDLDGDKVQCRFARQQQRECLNCPQHSFLELDEGKCILKFNGKAAAGQYFIYLMAEDLIPVPPSIQNTDNKPLSSVPVHLSLTVEESTNSCSDEPLATGVTPREDSMLFVLPYHEAKFDINFESQREGVLEVAVVGPPELFRVGFRSIGPLAKMSIAWIRSENNLTRLLPICFAVNTKSLQSEPRCVWLYQREMKTLPDGTELKCQKTEMTLVLPVASLRNIDLSELQLNSPTCPVVYNRTHLTATISLSGCGTKIVQSGSELVYTNTLKSVQPYTLVRRTPSLILPLACRIPGVQAKGPKFQLGIPTEKETFGAVRYWIEFYSPGYGPFAKFTRDPELRTLRMAPSRIRREVEPLSEINTPSSSNSSSFTNYTTPSSSPNRTTASFIDSTTRMEVGSKLNVLDLHVRSNCSINRAEMIVSNCLQSETEDFAVSFPILNQGCTTSNSTLEVITTNLNTKIYRLDLSNLKTKGTTMYVECTVNLCISTLPSQRCPEICSRTITEKTLIDGVYTKTYTIRSGPVSLVVTPAPATTPVATTTTRTTVATTSVQDTTSSHAPEQTCALAAGMLLTTISIFLQNVFLY
ncbi:uncharacterized protein [Labrus bergylta]|uniref:uncharacterized protein n=1 Tax=Labrus bergylta TaxID=56723 RepID=UPI003313BC6D